MLAAAELTELRAKKNLRHEAQAPMLQQLQSSKVKGMHVAMSLQRNGSTCGLSSTCPSGPVRGRRPHIESLCYRLWLQAQRKARSTGALGSATTPCCIVLSSTQASVVVNDDDQQQRSITPSGWGTTPTREEGQPTNMLEGGR